MAAVAPPSVNALAGDLVDDLIRRSNEHRVIVGTGAAGETLIDAGAAARGGLAAGLKLAEIAMGGLGRVALDAAPEGWPTRLSVRSSHPVLACLASQYAGWALSHEGWFALGSGPGRAAGSAEELFKELKYQDKDAGRAIFVLESASPPPEALVRDIAAACAVEPPALTFLYAPTQSLAGMAQIVARVLEVALHKAHALRFPLDRIIDGVASAPLAPPAPDFVAAMGRSNDAIIFGGTAHLFVSGPESDAKALAEQLPSGRSRDYGAPFTEIFAKFNGDFYAIDPMLFSPAVAVVTSLETGRSFRAGDIDHARLAASFAV